MQSFSIWDREAAAVFGCPQLSKKKAKKYKVDRQPVFEYNNSCTFPTGALYAGMAELADASDLGSGEAIRAGSSPVTRIHKNPDRPLGGPDFCRGGIVYGANLLCL